MTIEHDWDRCKERACQLCAAYRAGRKRGVEETVVCMLHSPRCKCIPCRAANRAILSRPDIGRQVVQGRFDRR